MLSREHNCCNSRTQEQKRHGHFQLVKTHGLRQMINLSVYQGLPLLVHHEHGRICWHRLNFRHCLVCIASSFSAMLEQGPARGSGGGGPQAWSPDLKLLVVCVCVYVCVLCVCICEKHKPRENKLAMPASHSPLSRLFLNSKSMLCSYVSWSMHHAPMCPKEGLPLCWNICWTLAL